MSKSAGGYQSQHCQASSIYFRQKILPSSVLFRCDCSGGLTMTTAFQMLLRRHQSAIDVEIHSGVKHIFYGYLVYGGKSENRKIRSSCYASSSGYGEVCKAVISE
ncbi:hypothetical protein N7537_006644 [Penicillium hordei]|uniref:Uncharacterized protein n=1 Tax=Penicillium hordei TaxID=40994 RepID=A0AAD6E800_9EURO|nr:uncharacterized protein N7537_006644 [Penicillium hordei]KAJ5603688.1 hypothetical protein N7537_006644 [Penicillium hordei]